MMSEKTLTRMDLSEAVFREVGLSRNESANLVEAVLQHMSDALAAGETVKISSFGTFSVRAKTARVGRNPKTGDEVPISPRRVLTFRPSHLMKDRVAAGKKKLRERAADGQSRPTPSAPSAKWPRCWIRRPMCCGSGKAGFRRSARSNGPAGGAITAPPMWRCWPGSSVCCMTKA